MDSSIINGSGECIAQKTRCRPGSSARYYQPSKTFLVHKGLIKQHCGVAICFWCGDWSHFLESSFFGSFIGTLIWVFVGWILWSAVTWFVGTKLFGGQATLDEMLRVIGFAHAPQFLAIIPCIGGIIGGIWSLIAGFIAVRQGLDLDNLKTLITILVGFIRVVIGQILITTVMGGVGHLFG